jgi:hypothetical protein
MRKELDQLVSATLEGDDRSGWVLKHLLDYCVDLEARSPDEWEGQSDERAWPDPGWADMMPALAYFLPTPAELEEVKRRFRLDLVQDRRLNPYVMRTLDRAADRSVFFPLVDVLEGYDGDPSRYDEITGAMHILGLAAADVPEADVPRAKHALEHVRDIGTDVTSRGYSLRYWASNALVGFGDEEADPEIDEEHPLAEDRAELAAEISARSAERFAARTAEVLVTVDKLDEQCASHLYSWSSIDSEGAIMGTPLFAVSGTLAAIYEHFNPYTALRSGMWVSCLEAASLPTFFHDVAVARWQKPERVQVLVKDDEPYFVLYMLSDGELRRCAPQPPSSGSEG